MPEGLYPPLCGTSVVSPRADKSRGRSPCGESAHSPLTLIPGRFPSSRKHKPPSSIIHQVPNFIMEPPDTRAGCSTLLPGWESAGSGRPEGPRRKRVRFAWPQDFLLTIPLPLLSAGSAYYDNVRPLAYPDSDAVLICFDISRPETLDSVLKKWQGETQEFCPNAKIVLVGCKLDMRTDLNTLRELSKQRLIPVTHEQGSALARQIGAVAYAECSSKVSENSVRDVFHVTTLASVNRVHKNLKRSNSKRGLKRASQMPGRTDLLNDTEIRKDRAKSCSIM
ncbi:PREDICTED: rho-related GTP-binding protein RhoN [Cariama cristata]|nr:PREDICTED: rho-related GTP-binding protein RhoN [Cariama cristata]